MHGSKDNSLLLTYNTDQSALYLEVKYHRLSAHNHDIYRLVHVYIFLCLRDLIKLCRN